MIIATEELSNLKLGSYIENELEYRFKVISIEPLSILYVGNAELTENEILEQMKGTFHIVFEVDSKTEVY